MADYNAIRKAYEEDEKLNENLNKKLSTNNTLYDNQKSTVTDTYNKQIKDSKLEYEDAYRENAVQKKVNEFYIKEDMANMGLSDSGLSRSQITANQISYSNQKADIDRQRQSMVDGLTREMTTMLADLETERLSSEQSIRDKDIEYRDSLAAAQYGTEVEAETERHKADVEAETKRQEYYYDYLTESAKTIADTDAKEVDNKNSEYKSLYSHIYQSEDNDYDKKAQLIKAYMQRYDIDVSTAEGYNELSSLVQAAGVTMDEYLHYDKYGSVYDRDIYVDKTDNGGKVKGTYKTLGEHDYIIKVVDDTINWGGGIDNNTKVNIYYPNKKVVAKNVLLSDLKSKSVKEKINELTKGSGNEGRIETLKLDLSYEDF